MNDDRKFKERAELMKRLFLARISPDVIAKVADVSETTVYNDRVRVAKLYGINVPTAASSSLEKAERFRFLFGYYSKSKYKSDRDPMVKAARLSLGIEKIENYLYSMENLWDSLRMPQISANYPSAGNYMELLKKCYSYEKRSFVDEFYQAIADGVISYNSFQREDDVIEAATRFFSSNHREEITSYVVANPKEYFKPLFSILTEREYAILASYYGLDCEKKNLTVLGSVYGLSKQRISQIIEKAIRKLSIELGENLVYLLSSSARIDNLEKENQRLKEEYDRFSRETDEKIVKLEVENKNFLKKLEELNIDIDIPGVKFMYPAIKFLTKKIIDTNLTCRIFNKLYGENCRYLVDVVENWDTRRLRFLGRKTRIDIEMFFESNGFKIESFKAEDIALARLIVEKDGSKERNFGW